nr:immunoglobulin heavy chain junction region [Mus musculus]MBK4189046.1 immunoglobulin heavy chain junction region [Mus musculus]MBK4189047.1 immunoglobulin heavy chain junction region [Mus musculus]MBK4189048.1 immunoglobulin heavy chain junction region [Mus musculus]MBK4189049.1 immunoglobulin heavy chain junction region [Mus musculus]
CARPPGYYFDFW